MKRSDILKQLPMRFWAKIVFRGTHECWEWAGRTNKGGYGEYDYESKHKELAHRFMYFSLHSWDKSYLNVLHKCDNPRCCNPRHLFLGTRADNVADMVRKKRHSRGAKHSQVCKLKTNRGEQAGKSKLAKADILSIRNRTANGETKISIAKSFPQVLPRQIFKIINRESWSWL